MPTNISALTATAMDPIPKAIAEDMVTVTDIWFSYTGLATDTAMTVFASADPGSVATVGLGIYDGAAAAPTLYLGLTTTDRQPFQFPVVGGTTYFFKVTNPVAPTPLNALVRIYAWPRPNALAAAGSVLIVDDDSDFPATVLSSSVATVLGIVGINGSQFGDTVDSGIILVDDLVNVGNVNLVGADLVQTAAVTLPGSPGVDGIRSNRDHTFFVATHVHAGPEIVYAVSDAGVVSGTSWTLPSACWSLAPNLAGTILYWTQSTGASANTDIHRWDLVNDIALSDLVPDSAPAFVTQDMLILPDDSLLIGYCNLSGPTFEVRRISAAGAPIHTYAFGNVFASASLDYRLSLGPGGTYFEVKFIGENASIHDGQQNLQQIRISDGAVLNSYWIATFQSGSGPIVASPTLPPFNGPGFSTPIISLQVDVQPTALPLPAPPPPSPTTTVTYPMRRLRQSAHLSHEQMWQFFHRFQLDLEAGVGLNDGFGSDPQVMLSWSDDGGHTWSQEHWVSAGKMGAYTQRAIWRMLGRSRDRVWRVVVDAPVRWRFLQAFADVTLGTS